MQVRSTLLFAVFITVGAPLSAQSPAAGALAATTAPPPPLAESLPRPDFRFKGQVGRIYQDSDPPTFPPGCAPAQWCTQRPANPAR